MSIGRSLLIAWTVVSTLMIAIVNDATAISEVGVRPHVDGRERHVEYAISISDGAGLRIEAADPHSGGDLPLPEHFPIRLKIAQQEPSGTKMTKWDRTLVSGGGGVQLGSTDHLARG